ncbi:MAG: tail fiber protein [Rhodothermia bacterium]|nr:tail fiber protein [Rhodothermia bacterium]NNE35120.1 phage tail protein [Rhodothermales bacterium]
MFAGNFAPRDWAFCDGQILSIATNQALFALLGTTYGGDGRTTFALPDLRGRAPIHSGSGAGPGLTTRPLGSSGGAESVALGAANIPGHSHTVKASTSEGGFDNPEGRYPARPASGIPQYGDQTDTTMAADTVADLGTASPHENMPPFVAINYIIAIAGAFPSRN